MSNAPAGPAPAAGESAPAAAPSLAKSAGVGSLIRGNRSPAAPKPGSPRSAKVSIPRWYLFGGDLLLVALALIIAYKSPSPLNWQKVLFCSVVVALGAGLAIIALRTSEPSQNGERMKISPFSSGRRK